jgi:hypothetical protein
MSARPNSAMLVPNQTTQDHAHFPRAGQYVCGAVTPNTPVQRNLPRFRIFGNHIGLAPDRLSTQSIPQLLHILGMGNLKRPQRLQMRVHDLGVEDRESQFSTLLHHRPQSDFRSIRCPMKHGLCAEARPDGDAVDSSDEFAILPTLTGVTPSFVVDERVDPDELLADPIAIRPEARAHDFFESSIESDFELISVDHLLEASGDMDALDGEERPPPRLKPLDFAFLHRHGERAFFIGVPDQPRREFETIHRPLPRSWD